MVIITGADALATQGARASATMILAMLNRNNSVPARWCLRPVSTGQDIRGYCCKYKEVFPKTGLIQLNAQTFQNGNACFAGRNTISTAPTSQLLSL